MSVSLEFDTFSIRDNERVQMLTDKPDSGRFIAIMARSCELPPGPHQSVRTSDNEPVESAAIVAAIWSHVRQNWQWQQLSSVSKEYLGDVMFANECEKDRWYYMTFEDLSLAASVAAEGAVTG